MPKLAGVLLSFKDTTEAAFVQNHSTVDGGSVAVDNTVERTAVASNKMLMMTEWRQHV